MDKKAVRDALTTVDEALRDEDFRKWLEQNNDNLVFDYDHETSACECPEERDSFEVWALWRYVKVDD